MRRERAAQRGQGAEREAQTREVAGPRVAERDPREDALHVADRFQCGAQRLVAPAVDECAHRRVPLAQLRAVGDRSPDGAAQRAGAHRRDRGVEQRHQRRVLTTRGAGVDLEVAPGDGVDLQRGLARFDAQRAEVGQRRALRVAYELQQRARRADGERQLGGAVAREVERAELRGQQPRRSLGLEVPGRAGSAAPTGQRRRPPACLGEAVGQQELRGPQPL